MPFASRHPRGLLASWSGALVLLASWLLLSPTVAEAQTNLLEFTPTVLGVPYGSSSAYTVRLATAPAQTVTVTISGHVSAAHYFVLTLDKTTLTFTPSNWSTPQTVTVSTNQHTTRNLARPLVHTLSGGATGSVSLRTLVTEGVEMLLDRSTLPVTEGGTASYSVRLLTAPAESLTVAIRVSAGTDVSLDKTRLTFTTANWSTPQVVAVTANHDADAVDERVRLRHQFVGENPAWDLWVEVADDDKPVRRLTFEPTSVTMPEGADAGYTVKLGSQPTGTVTVAIAGQAGTDVSLDKTRLTFTTANWSTPQTVRVSAGQDADAVDDTVTLRHTTTGGGYGSVTGTVTVTVEDDEVRRVVAVPGILTLAEGTTGSYTVRLSLPPSQTTTVTPVHWYGNALVRLSPESLTFTTANWSTPQTVTVTAVEDADGLDDSARIWNSGEPAYRRAPVTVNVTENDAVRPLYRPGSLTVNEGGTGTYEVRLAARPERTVTVAIAGQAGTDVWLDKTSLTFTRSNWSTPQTVTVNAGDDADAVGDTVTLRHTTTGGDIGTGTDYMVVTVLEDDRARLRFADTPVTVAEAGGTATYTVALNSEPSATVTVTPRSGDTSAATVSGALTFTTANWSTPQRVTVTGVDDDVDNASNRRTVTVTHTATGATEYAPLTGDVAVTVTDDDTAGLTVTDALTVTEASTKTYTVALSTEPAASVTVTISGATNDVTVDTDPGTDGDQTTLTFTTGNWDTARTVTVRAAANPDDDSVTLTHTASGASDYVGVTKDTTVTVDALPRVASITREVPTTSPTNADTLTWRVTFSENVQKADKTDFAVTGTTATVTSVTEVTASTVYDVTASEGDLASLDGTVTLSFAGTQNIEDSAGNALTSTAPTGTNDNTYAVDNTAPALSTAVINGKTLTLTYDGDLDTAAAPAKTDFTVKVGGSAVELAATGAVALATTTVTLTLKNAVAPTDTVTVSYTVPASNPLRDGVGNQAVALTDQAVTNSSSRPTLAITGPTSEQGAGAFTVTFTFGETVDGFAAADVTVPSGATKGTLTAGTGANADKVWTMPVTPGANLDTTAFTVSVAQDAATSKATGVGSAAATKDFAVDSKAPAISSAEVIGKTLTVTFDETLASAKAANSAWTVDLATGTDPTVSSYTLSGATATLTLSAAVPPGVTVELDYDKPDSGTVLEDVRGNDLADVTDQAVTNSSSRPTLAITGPTSEQGAAAFTVTFTFGETVDSFTAADVTVPNGTTKGTLTAGTGANVDKVWTLALTPAAGTDTAAFTVSVAQDAATSKATGVGSAAATKDFAVDSKAPAISSAEVIGKTLTVTFDETLASAKAANSAWTVDLATGTDPTVSSYTLSGATATLTLSAAVPPGVTVELDYDKPDSGTVLEDVRGNDLADVTDQAVTNSSSRPTLAITGPTSEQGAAAFTVTFTFGETVDSFTAADVTVPNGTTKGTLTAGTGANVDKVWTLALTPAAGTDTAAFTVSVAQDAATSKATGVGSAAATKDFAVDSKAPAISSAEVIGKTLTVTFDETLASAKAANSAWTVDLATGTDPTVSSYTLSGATATLTLSAAVPPGVTVELDYDKPDSGTVLEDVRGNDLADVTDQAVTNSSSRPTLAITGPTSEQGAAAFTVTFTFGETVDSFTAADVTVPNGTTKGTLTAGTGANVDKVWTLALTPAAGTDTAAFTVSVAQDAATSKATGVGSAAATKDFAVDSKAPAISSAEVIGKTLTVTFDETLASAKAANSAWTVDLATGTDPTVSSYTLSGATATLTLSAAVPPGVTVELDYDKPDSGTVLEDVRGNDLADVTDQAVTNSSSRPTLAITGPTSEQGAAAFTVTFTFGETVDSFTAADVTVPNGTTKGTLTAGTGANVDKVWTLALTPAAGTDTAAFTVSVAQDAATSKATGVGSAAATKDFAVDSKAPAISSAEVIGKTLTVTFDETLASAKAANSAWTVDLATGTDPTVSSYTLSGATATLTLSAAVPPGVTVELDYDKPDSGTVLEDVRGNDLADVTDQAVTNSSSRPTLAITGPTSEQGAAAFTVTFTFGETVDSFTAADVTVPNGTTKGTLTAGTGANVDKVWTLALTPAAGTDTAAFTVSVAQDAATSKATGVGSAAATKDFAVDSKAPAISSAEVIGKTLTVTFDETLASAKAANSAWTVDLATGTDPTVSSYTLSGATATLTLSAAVPPGVTVELDYDKPDSGTVLEDVRGNDLADVTDQAVTNSSTLAAPANLQALPGDRRVTLSWDAVAEATSYEYQQTTTGSFGDWTGGVGTETSAVVTGLDNGTRYTFRVRAVKTSSPRIEGLPSAEASATPSAPPLNLTATPGDGYVTLSWDPVAGVGRHNWLYEIYHGWQWFSAQERPVLGDDGRWTATLGGLTNGRTYTFQVIPCLAECHDLNERDAIVYGLPSNRVTVTLTASRPSQPFDFKVAPGDRRVTLSWDAVAEATGYEYVQRTAGGQYGDALLIADQHMHSYTITGLENNTRYLFRLRAVNGTVKGPYSEEKSATPTELSVQAPANLRAAPGNGRVTLNWDAVEGASGYQWSRLSYNNWRDVPADETSVTTTYVLNDVVQFFRVRTVKIIQAENPPQEVRIYSAPSNKAYVSPMANPTLPPPNLSVDIGDGHARLNWEWHGNNPNHPLVGATGYEYRTRTSGGSYPADADGGGWTSVGDIFHPPKTSHMVTELINSTRYHFQLRALNGTVPGNPSPEVSAVYGDEGGVDGAGTQRTQGPAGDAPPAPAGVRMRWDGDDLLVWWAGIPDSTGYVYTVGTGTPVDAGNKTWARIGGLGKSETHTVRIHARSGDGTSAASDAAVWWPPAPASIGIGAGDDVTLLWGAVSGATRYRYRYRDRAPAEGGGWGDWRAWGGWTEVSATSATISDLTSGNQYAFEVETQARLYEPDGDLHWSPKSATTAETIPASTAPQLAQGPAEDAPPAPAGVRMRWDGSDLLVWWAGIADSTGYAYTRETGDETHGPTDVGNQTWARIAGLDRDEAHVVRILATSAALGTSGVSEPAVWWPPKPASASVTAAGALTWEAVAEAHKYRWRLKKGEGAWGSWTEVAATATGATLTGLAQAGVYTVEVGTRARLYEPDGDFHWSQSAAVATVDTTPPTLSVADARVAEPAAGETASLDFAVTLAPAAPVTVTVVYWTVEGTATAESDYTPVLNTLTFAAGETSKTVPVAVLPDSHDDSGETLTFRLGNASGASISDGEATGTITNDGPIPKAWIARFGRTVADQVVDAVTTRLGIPRAAGIEGTIAGEALPSWTPAGKSGQATAADRRDAADAMHRLMAFAGADAADPGSGSPRPVSGAGPASWPDRAHGTPGFGTRTVTGHELLAGTSFALTAASRGPGGGFVSLWGRGTFSGFDGREGGLALDGQVTAGFLGADWSSGADPKTGVGNWTAGLAVGHSTGTGGYRQGDCTPGDGADAPDCGGKVEAALTGLYPYAGVNLNERLSLWLATGWGSGEFTLRPDRSAALTADLDMAMSAAGVRGEVLRSEGGDGFSLTVKADARFTQTSTDAANSAHGNLAAAETETWLARAGIEGSRAVALGNGGATLTPSFEVGVRLDGGDAETGMGADLGGGVAFADPKSGLSLDFGGHGLVVHEQSGFREWGASAAFAWDPRPETDRGLSLSLTRSWGASPSGGMDGLLDSETLAGFAANGDDPASGDGFRAAGRLEGEIGYGTAMFGDRFTGTPNLGFALSDGGARNYGIGWRLTSAVHGDPGFEVRLDAMRREAANDDRAPVGHEVRFEINAYW